MAVLARSDPPAASSCSCLYVLTKHMKQGENGEPDEVEIEAHIFTCKVCCNGCNKQFKGAKEVNKKEFGESLVDGCWHAGWESCL